MSHCVKQFMHIYADLLGLELTGAFGNWLKTLLNLLGYISLWKTSNKKEEKDWGEQICYYLEKKKEITSL